MGNKMVEIHADRDEFSFEHPPEVVRVVRELNAEHLRRYGDDNQLVDILANWHNVSSDKIFIESGTINIIHRVFDNILNADSSVLLPSPSYPYYHKLARHHNTPIKKYRIKEKEDKFEHDLEDLISGIEQGPKIAVIIDPESPLGCSIPEEYLRRVLDKSSSETLVILDQTHEGFRKENVKDIGKLVGDYPNLMITRSFSKFYGLAGKRIAYAVCGDNVKGMIRFFNKYLGFDVSSQPIALAALNSEEHYRKIAEIVSKEKERFEKSINSIPSYKAYKTDTGSVIVGVPQEQVSYLEQNALAAEVRFRNLASYNQALQENSLDGLFRVTIGSKEDNDRILDIFHVVGWLFEMPTINFNPKRTINTRDSGYTIHRIEWYCPHTKMQNSWYKVIVPPGHKVPAHYHDSQDEYFHFLDSGKIIIDGNLYNFNADTFIPVKPGQKHEIQALPNKFLRYFCSRFPYSHSDKYTLGNQIIHRE